MKNINSHLRRFFVASGWVNLYPQRASFFLNGSTFLPECISYLYIDREYDTCK